MRKLLLSLPLTCVIVAALTLVGCGGGGGGGTGPASGSTGGTLNVFASFTPGASGGPVGQSEVIKVSTQAGVVLQTQTVTSNGRGQTPKQVVFSTLPNATLLMHATLFSGPNGAGSAVGSVDTSFAGEGITSVVTAMAQPVTHLTLSPTNIAIASGTTQQLLATPTDDNGEVVFVASLPTWAVAVGSGTVGSIDSKGLFSGTGVGLATVTASLGTLSGSAEVSVTRVTNGAWTIMLFLNSANDLDAESLVNIQQIERIAQTAASPTRFVIQWKLTPNAGIDIPDHPFDGTRRYLAVQNNLEFLQNLGTGVDMGSSATLKNFVSWSVQNYPAQHYMLIMWDHGNGWFMRNALPTVPRWRGISYDFESGNHIDVNQIASAIRPNHLDIISFDACLMQMLEVQDELTGVANYMVCSEDNTPGPGYPYDASFAQFYSNPTGSTVTLAKGIVDGFINSYDNDPNYSLTPLSHSVVDLSKITGVTSALNTFSNDLLAGNPSLGGTTSALRRGLLNYAAGDGYNYYDIGAVAQGFSSSNSSALITQSGSALASAEQAAVVYSKTDGHSPNSTGMAIEFGNSALFDQYSSDYARLLLAQQTHWSKFLGNTALNP